MRNSPIKKFRVPRDLAYLQVAKSSISIYIVLIPVEAQFPHPPAEMDVFGRGRSSSQMKSRLAHFA